MPKHSARVWRASGRAILTFALTSAATAPVARGVTSGAFDLSWTDRVGGVHQLANDIVTVSDSYNGTETVVGTYVTNGLGHVTFQTSQAHADGSPLNLVVDVSAQVNNVGRASDDFIHSPFVVRLPGSYSFTANSSRTAYATPAVDNTTDAGKAIGFMQGLAVIHDQYASLGASVPYASVRFAPAWGNGSYMNGANMTLGYDSWGAWDVAFHEFGHGLASYNQLDAEPPIGASHSFNQDNISSGPSLGPQNGAKFAWQEGIATYMGTSALHDALPGRIAGMPAADSNTWYDRYAATGTTTPDSSAQFNVDLENRLGVIPPTTYVITGKGEGDELTVARVLWDLEDDTPNEALPRAGRTDQVALGPQAVFNLMKAAGANNNGRLIDLWSAARQQYGQTPAARARLGDIFEANTVSPIPGAAGGVADGGTTTSTTPTLAWTPQDAGHSTAFMVAVYSQDWSTLLEESGSLAGTSWTLPDPLADGTYNWVVIGNSVVQSDVSFDDSYWSGGASFTIAVPEPGVAGVVAVGAMLMVRRRGKMG